MLLQVVGGVEEEDNTIRNLTTRSKYKAACGVANGVLPILAFMRASSPPTVGPVETAGGGPHLRYPLPNRNPQAANC